MFLLLTRIMLWLVVLGGLGYAASQLVPKPYSNYAGYVLAGFVLMLTLFEPTSVSAVALWNVLSLPLQPLGLLCILLLQVVRGDLGSAPVRNQLVTAVTLLIVLSMSYFPRVITQKFVERDAYLLQEASIKQPSGIPEAIVLLGWQTTAPDRIEGRSAQLADNGDLVLHAANLFLQGQAPRIIISAGPRLDYTRSGAPPIEAQTIYRLLQRLGVPRDAIVVENKGIDIRSSARNVNALLEQYGIPKDIVLVSTAISSYRAMQSFYQLGINVSPRPAMFRTEQPLNQLIPMPKGREFIPTVEGLMFSTELINEFLASIYYFLRGWMTPGELLLNELRSQLPIEENALDNELTKLANLSSKVQTPIMPLLRPELAIAAPQISA